MNNYVFPAFPNQPQNIMIEIQKLKDRISILEEKIKKVENDKEEKYLKKEDNYYMI